eukprot:m.166055 g.166055  ORF g.166055 m.166055 type:complete len:457 (+) comp31414_c0_seq1:220-1590(+)
MGSSPVYVLLVLLGLTQLYVLFKLNTHSSGVALDDPDVLPERDNVHRHDNAKSTSTLKVEIDDLMWYTPRPSKPVRFGWEDEWMMNWKTRTYDSTERLGCTYTPDESPYKGGLLCTIPKYVPPRLDPKLLGPQKIPRVIFMSWLTAKVGRAGLSSVVSWLNHNPAYELIFWEDSDIDDFMCANYRHDAIFNPFTTLRAGAARVDVVRMLIMQRYGGVYVDYDLSALNPLPITSINTVVSGIGCWDNAHERPGDNYGGVLEHWALSYVAHHPIIEETVKIITQNLNDPTMFAFPTQDLTGPVPYQVATHKLLKQASCLPVDNTYCQSLARPLELCEFTIFQSLFGNATFFPEVTYNHTFTDKLYMTFHDEEDVMSHEIDYDNPQVKRTREPDLEFCSALTQHRKLRELEKKWEEMKKFVEDTPDTEPPCDCDHEGDKEETADNPAVEKDMDVESKNE